VLFSAGEIEAGSDVAESVVDSSEIINTLKGGGISSLGYADVEVDESNRGGLLSRLRGDSDSGIDSTETTNRVTSLVRKATLGRLTLPCEVNGTERALLVVAGPPEYLNRKGSNTVGSGSKSRQDRWRFAVVTIHGAEREQSQRSFCWVA